jgi:Fe-S-cluster-containing dehydrogenase component
LHLPSACSNITNIQEYPFLLRKVRFERRFPSVSQKEDLERSCIKTTLSPKDQLNGPIVCLHCQEPECAKVCPTGALVKNPEKGIVAVEEAKCIGCLLCTMACPYGGIYPERNAQKVYKCDLCGGDPECVKVCPVGALIFKEAD